MLRGVYGVIALAVLGAGCTGADPLDTFVPLERIPFKGAEAPDYGPWFSVSSSEIALQFRVPSAPPSKGERFTLGTRRDVELEGGRARIPAAAVAKLKASMRNGKRDVASNDVVSIVADRRTPTQTLRMIYTAAGLLSVTRGKLVLADDDVKKTRTTLTIHPFSRLALKRREEGARQTVVGIRQDPATKALAASVSVDGAPFEALASAWEGEVACAVLPAQQTALAEAICRRASEAQLAIDVDDDTTAEDLAKLVNVFRESSCGIEATLLSRRGADELLGAVQCEAPTAPPSSTSSPTPPAPAEWTMVGKTVIEGVTATEAKVLRESIVAASARVGACVPAPATGKTLVAVQIVPKTAGGQKKSTPQVSVAQAPGIDAAARACIAAALASVTPRAEQYRLAQVWLRGGR